MYTGVEDILLMINRIFGGSGEKYFVYLLKHFNMDSKKPTINTFSGNQVKRLVRIADRNPERANRVLDRMKKRKDIQGDAQIIKGSGIKYTLTKEEQDKTKAVGGLRQPNKPIAEGSSQFKQVDLKSDKKPISGSSAFKYVELKGNKNKTGY